MMADPFELNPDPLRPDVTPETHAAETPKWSFDPAARMRELQELLGRGTGTANIRDAAKSRAVAKAVNDAGIGRAYGKMPANDMMKFRGDMGAPDPTYTGPNWHGDMQATPRDLRYADKYGGQRGVTNSFERQFGMETDLDRPSGYVPIPYPRKPWIDNTGGMLDELGGASQNLPPGVTVRRGDAKQIQEDLSSPEDEDILNRIMEGMNKKQQTPPRNRR